MVSDRAIARPAELGPQQTSGGADTTS